MRSHGFSLDNGVIAATSIGIVVFSFLSHVAVCGFIIITGFFLINSRFNLRHFLRILLELFFYGMAWFAVLLCSGKQPFSWSFLVASLLPSLYQYWFIACYLVLFIFAPFINAGLKKLSLKLFAILLVCLFVFGSLIPTFALRSLLFEKLGFVLLFCFCYVLGAFFSKFQIKINRYWRLNSILCFFTGIGCSLGVLFYNQKMGSDYDPLLFVRDFSPFVLGVSAGLFLEFSSFKARSFPWINVLASAVFGIYLFHENAFSTDFIYQQIFHVADYASSAYLFLYCFGFTCCIMTPLETFSTKEIVSDCGFKPSVSFKEGVRLTYDYLKSLEAK